MMKERIAIIDGIRTPMAPAGKDLKDIQADDLGVFPVREILDRTSIDAKDIDEVIIGNVAQPTHAANIARVIALKAGMPIDMPAYTVHRNCASGMQSITTGALKILNGQADIILAGGVESMSNIPFLYSEEMKNFFIRLSRSKGFFEKLGTLFSFRPGYLKPQIGVTQGLTDPVSGLIMGETAEVLAREFHITREEQDEFALQSHNRALKAQEEGIFQDEILPIPVKGAEDGIMQKDSGPRPGQSMKKLAKLKPYFDRKNGTVTVGNSCPVTDGAAAVILMSETKAKELGYKPLGYLREFAYTAHDPSRMGLGPVFSTSKLLERSGASLKDFELIEMNEAFAAQMLANYRTFPSKEFAQRELGRSEPLGELDNDIVNVNGGAIALGHPVGMTGTRLVITVLKNLRRLKKNTGLATLCIGGGQGAALFLEIT
ncbi:MAG: thiolase family protein [Spirochaetia bacterium]